MRCQSNLETFCYLGFKNSLDGQSSSRIWEAVTLELELPAVWTQPFISFLSFYIITFRTPASVYHRRAASLRGDPDIWAEAAGAERGAAETSFRYLGGVSKAGNPSPPTASPPTIDASIQDRLRSPPLFCDPRQTQRGVRGQQPLCVAPGARVHLQPDSPAAPGQAVWTGPPAGGERHPRSTCSERGQGL